MGNIDWKKVGVIALFVGSILLFAFFLYYFFFRPLFLTPETPTNINNAVNNGQLPVTVNINGRTYIVNTNAGLGAGANINQIITPVTAGQEPTATAQGGLTKIEQMTKGPSMFSVVGPNGEIIYYNPADGKFYILTASGEIKEYNGKVFHNVSNVVWSQNKNKAVLEYPDGSNIVYDFNTNEQVTLPKHWYDFSFSPTDDQIGFKSNALDVENRFLAVSKPDGSGPAILESLGEVGNKFNVNWSPNNQVVATFVDAKDADRSEVFFIGLNKENFKSMVVEGRDFRGFWSPDGQKMLYSVYNSQDNFAPKLWISNASPDSVGDNRQNLELNTWADKCTFSSQTKIYCAVPEQLVYGSGLEPSSADQTPDQLYEIDLTTGSKNLIAVPTGNHTIGNIIVNEANKTLYFSDKNSNIIYKINL